MRINQTVPDGKTLTAGPLSWRGPCQAVAVIRDGVEPALTDTPAEPSPPTAEEAAALQALAKLQSTDAKMIRVIEDLIYILVTKGTIALNDFDPVVKARLLERAEARGMI